MLVQLGDFGGGLALIVLRLGIGAGLDQQPDHRRIVMRRRNHQSGGAGFRLCIHIGAALDKPFGDLERPRARRQEHRALRRGVLRDGDHQRRQSVGASRHVYVGAALHQGFRHFIFVLGDGDGERTESFRARLLGVRAIGEQDFDRRHVVAHHGGGKRGHAVSVGLVDIGTQLDEQLDHLVLPLAGGVGERRAALVVGLVDVGALLNQEFHAVLIVGDDGVAQLLSEVGAFGEPALELLLGDHLVRRSEVGTRLVIGLGDLGIGAVGRQIARDDAFAALDERHAVILEDLLDILLVILKRELDHVFEEGVGAAHANPELEFERHLIVHHVDRQDGDRLALHGLDPAGEGTEYRGHVELAIEHALDDVPGLVLDHDIGVVGLGLEFEVVHDAAPGERHADARRLEHADLEILELGIVEAGDLKALVVADKRGRKASCKPGRW